MRLDVAAAAILQLCIASWLGTKLATRGYKKGSLDKSGARAAFWVGTLILGSSFSFGLVLLVFYFSGSAFTRWKASVKRAYDLEVRGEGGRRTAAQVLCTAGVGTAVAVAYVVLTDGRAGACWVPQALASVAQSTHIWAGWPYRLLLAFLGSFACVTGDTWASELGILSRAPPRLVTNCRRVPRGTNGAISLWGTAVSAAGGAAVGAMLALDPYIKAFARALVSVVLVSVWGLAAGSGLVGRGQPAKDLTELVTGAVTAARDMWAASPASVCSTIAAGGSAREGTLVEVTADFSHQLALVLAGAVLGLAGSLLDSVLGATLQRSWYDPQTGRASATLPDGCVESPVPFDADMLVHGEAAAARTVREGLKKDAHASNSGGQAGQAAKSSSVSSKTAPGAADGLRKRAGKAGGQAESKDGAADKAANGHNSTTPSQPEPRELVAVCGYPILSNEQVNALSCGLTALAGALWGPALVQSLAGMVKAN